jgi:glycosyltransferase involved in cell wall biosynthesis
MKISVVICTYNRYDVLDDSIDSVLKAGARVDGQYELLIIDNNPKETRKNIRVSKSKNIRIIDENKIGLSNARNRGISESTGDIVLFNDDDIFASSNYLNEYLEFFQKNTRCMVAGGKTSPHYEGEKPLWLSDSTEKYLSVIDYGAKNRPIKQGEYLVGANIAFKKDVFEKFGLFDVNLGRSGSASLLSNEETEFVKQIPGFPYYLAQAEVKHRIFPERLEKNWFKKRVAWQAISDFVSGFKMDANSVHNELNSISQKFISEDIHELKDSEIFDLELRKVYLDSTSLIMGL